MQCDICNTHITYGAEEQITPDVFTYLIDNGFELDEINIKMLTDNGMSRSAAEDALRDQYRHSKSDWLLCPNCAAKAKDIVSQSNEKWVDHSYLAVTHIAEKVGLGFDIIGAPVALSREVWQECVQWYDRDTERQVYQEQDARLWDVMFTGGGTLQLKVNNFLKNQIHRYSVLCIPRDGKSTDAIKINLLISPKKIRGQQWLVIDKGEQTRSDDA